jgi:hypothetical protein
MKFADFLRSQLTDIVDYYQQYLRRTIGTTIIFTAICFVIAAFLLHFTEFSGRAAKAQISLLNYFFLSYSGDNVYRIVDLTKDVFIFFVALFSIGFARLKKEEIPAEITFSLLIRKINLKDVTVLAGIFILSAIIDYFLFKMDGYSAGHTRNRSVDKYIHGTIFQLRIYIPLILFGLGIYVLSASEKVKLKAKNILFIYISLWLFNEFAYELFMWCRYHVFALVLMPFDKSDSYYLLESVPGIVLIAFFFLGYHSALTKATSTEV